MAIWHKVSKDAKGIEEFMECNWCFHDFRIERVSYIPGKKLAEVFMMYDTGREGVLLKFLGTQGVNIDINPNGEYLADWLYGATLLLKENNRLQWLATDDLTQEEMKAPPVTWVESDEIIWAVTDSNGYPIPLPNDRLNQVWNHYGKVIEKHFSFQEWNGSI